MAMVLPIGILAHLRDLKRILAVLSAATFGTLTYEFSTVARGADAAIDSVARQWMPI
jgi:hypothetical protein